MSDDHSIIIATAAKSQLASLGFQQKGRSRLWLADRGYWLNVAEFTPSRWTKSVSLMNAAHWFWTGAGFMSYNEAIPSNCQADFETEDQFRRASIEIAKIARATALEIEKKFSSFDAIADFSIERAQSSPDRMQPSWWGFEAGLASGLVGKFEEADYFLRGITDERVVRHAAPFLSLIGHSESFKGKVNDLISQQRSRLKLTALNSQSF